MPEITPDDLQFFDREQEHSVVWKRLPHWTQAGAVAFVTWRTADSMPKEIFNQWTRERDEYLIANGLNPASDWKQSLGQLPPKDWGRIRWWLFNEWDRRLDNGAGECVLADPNLSLIIMNSLTHFDGDRYLLTDAVVMPNHVHLLAAFRSEELMLDQCTSWKHFTATAIHRLQRERQKRGEEEIPSAERRDNRTYEPKAFWLVEQFDHLVRSQEQFDYLRKYIAENPARARLADGMYRHYSKPL
jgi:putative transposase